MMKTYHTAQVAALTGVHPNTVRFYEQQGLLPPVPRRDNGYRVYTERHLCQLRLVRLAFRAGILSGNLRREAVGIVKTAAGMEHASAAAQTRLYREHLREEIGRARKAIALTEQIVRGELSEPAGPVMGRREAAAALGVSVDVLRDWERNGLLRVPRSAGRRSYGRRELDLLRIIQVLRGANYSQMSIRRMLEKLERGETDILRTIDTPDPTEDIVSVADRYITSLTGALRDAAEMLRLLRAMEEEHQGT